MKTRRLSLQSHRSSAQSASEGLSRGRFSIDTRAITAKRPRFSQGRDSEEQDCLCGTPEGRPRHDSRYLIGVIELRRPHYGLDRIQDRLGGLSSEQSRGRGQARARSFPEGQGPAPTAQRPCVEALLALEDHKVSQDPEGFSAQRQRQLSEGP